MPKRTRLAIAVGALLTATAAMLAMHITMPSLASAHEDHGNFSAGQPGDPKKPARVVAIKMFEGSGKMGYEPARIEVRRGDKSVSSSKTMARRITNSSSRRSLKIVSTRR
jgi:hypothetical protein